MALVAGPISWYTAKPKRHEMPQIPLLTGKETDDDHNTTDGCPGGRGGSLPGNGDTRGRTGDGARPFSCQTDRGNGPGRCETRYGARAVPIYSAGRPQPGSL